MKPLGGKKKKNGSMACSAFASSVSKMCIAAVSCNMMLCVECYMSLVVYWSL